MDAGTGYFARLAGCVGKESFSTPQLAQKVVRRRATKPLHRKGRSKHAYHSNAEVYHCPHCGLFHIGTKAKSLHARRQRDHEDDGGR